jgi:NAD(P)-dependent dehydrogenase (short-subunit alcohol dehydrogenase family)
LLQLELKLLIQSKQQPKLNNTNLKLTTMSSNNGGEKPPQEGMQAEGLPVGPEIKEHSQYDPNKERTGQPGIQEEMETQPIETLLPTHHAHQGLHDQLQMDEYKGVGKFNSKVCLVTGGDSGIGRSIALMLAKEGAQCVAITHLEKEKVDADKTKTMIEKEMIGGKGGTKPVQSRLFCQDLSHGEDSCRAIISQLSSEYGRIDCLFLNHAIQYYSPSIGNTSEDILMDTFKTNFFSFVYLAKHAIPIMPRGGAIVCSTSVTAYAGSPSLLEYSCTKGAIVSFVRSLAKQVASKGIRVNAVAAGPVSY